MPIYQCICPEGLLGESARGELAEEITRIHCAATGVPPAFVNVMFLDVPDGRYFVAGKRSGHSVLNAAIRVGRDLGTRQRILRELPQMWTRLTGQAEGELLISLSGLLELLPILRDIASASVYEDVARAALWPGSRRAGPP